MEALRQPENRLKGFLRPAGGASRPTSRANPHRVKRNGRRHGNRTTGHSVYANDNPVRFTDPLGRQAQETDEKETCGTVCQEKRRYERNFGKESDLARGARKIAEGASTAGDVVEIVYETALPVPVVKVGLLGKVGKFVKRLFKRVPKHGSTPSGRPFTKHYGKDTGPQRNIPGSVVDNTIDTTKGVAVGGGKTVHYDPVNNVTVVTGDGGSIVSARKGPPRKGQY